MIRRAWTNKDLAYWDAIVCYDIKTKEIIACQSQVIDCKEATRLINKHIEESQEKVKGYTLDEKKDHQDKKELDQLMLALLPF